MLAVVAGALGPGVAALVHAEGVLVGRGAARHVGVHVPHLAVRLVVAGVEGVVYGVVTDHRVVIDDRVQRVLQRLAGQSFGRVVVAVRDVAAVVHERRGHVVHGVAVQILDAVDGQVLLARNHHRDGEFDLVGLAGDQIRAGDRAAGQRVVAGDLGRGRGHRFGEGHANDRGTRSVDAAHYGRGRIAHEDDVGRRIGRQAAQGAGRTVHRTGDRVESTQVQAGHDGTGHVDRAARVADGPLVRIRIAGGAGRVLDAHQHAFPVLVVGRAGRHDLRRRQADEGARKHRAGDHRVAVNFLDRAADRDLGARRDVVVVSLDPQTAARAGTVLDDVEERVVGGHDAGRRHFGADVGRGIARTLDLGDGRDQRHAVDELVGNGLGRHVVRRGDLVVDRGAAGLAGNRRDGLVGVAADVRHGEGVGQRTGGRAPGQRDRGDRRNRVGDRRLHVDRLAGCGRGGHRDDRVDHRGLGIVGPVRARRGVGRIVDRGGRPLGRVEGGARRGHALVAHEGHVLEERIGRQDVVDRRAGVVLQPRAVAHLAVPVRGVLRPGLGGEVDRERNYRRRIAGHQGLARSDRAREIPGEDVHAVAYGRQLPAGQIDGIGTRVPDLDVAVGQVVHPRIAQLGDQNVGLGGDGNQQVRQQQGKDHEGQARMDEYLGHTDHLEGGGRTVREFLGFLALNSTTTAGKIK